LTAIAFLAGIEQRNQHSVSSFFDAFRSWQSFINALQNQSHETTWALVLCVAYAAKRLYDGLKAFGVAPAALLASRSGAPSLQDLEKQTALRQSFGVELREVTQALGKRQRIACPITSVWSWKR
jgi:hypothetical protein